ncbi:MAG: PEP-CTERM-box response regulator transcription factor [Dongiaceae bacterium]
MSAEKEKLLVVEDDPGLQRQLRWSLAEFEVLTAGDQAAAIAAVEAHEPPIVVLDLGLPPDAGGASEGLAVLKAIRVRWPRIKVIILTGNEDRAHALSAVGLGAYDYCSKPIDIDLLRIIVGRARHLYGLEQELLKANRDVAATPLPGLITASPAMLQICRRVERVAGTDITVLLLGESGTGKEVVARALHDLSPRASKPFVAINCGAIPENLLESELFGHEKGSFTGAVKQTIGKVEFAQGGTIFLDEISDVPLALQVKLLRFLQERVIERVGGRQSIRIDVRVVCATNRDLAEMIREGKFREDLFYRLNELIVRLPPLRERGGDAVLLAQYFLNRFSQQYDRPIRGLAPDAKALIGSYGWPGNIRELQSQMRRAVLMTETDLISAADFDLPGATPPAKACNGPPASLKMVRRTAERQALIDALCSVNGNISHAARLLGVSRPTVYELMRIHGVRA